MSCLSLALLGIPSHSAAQAEADTVLVFPRSERDFEQLEDRYEVLGRFDVDDRMAIVLRLDRKDREAVAAFGSLQSVEAAGIERLRKGSRQIANFPCYRTVEETYADLSALASSNPTLAQWVDLGDSWQKVDNPSGGYDLQALVLGNAETGGKVPMVLIAAIHARELVTAEIATRFAEELIEGYDTDPEVRWLLDTVEIHIVPQLNPDGRKKAEAGELWRKNVNPTCAPSPSADGVDLNRNSSFQWNQGGASGDPCSLLYRGNAAGSEPETQAIESYLQSVFTDQRGELLSDAAPETTEGVFASLHSYGDFVLYPWEYTQSVPAPNLSQLATLGRKLGFITGYAVCDDEPGCLGATSGTTVDQAYGEFGVAAYTFEFGSSFFQSCTTFESSIVGPAIESLRYLARVARRPYQWPSGPEVVSATLDLQAIVAGDPIQLSATGDDTRSSSHGFGSDPQHAVVAAYYWLDQLPWQGSGMPMSPADGSFDSTVEGLVATLDTAGLELGRHVVYVAAEDVSGAIGPPAVLDFDVLALFADAFESGELSSWD